MKAVTVHLVFLLALAAGCCAPLTVPSDTTLPESALPALREALGFRAADIVRVSSLVYRRRSDCTVLGAALTLRQENGGWYHQTFVWLSEDDEVWTGDELYLYRPKIVRFPLEALRLTEFCELPVPEMRKHLASLRGRVTKSAPEDGHRGDTRRRQP